MDPGPTASARILVLAGTAEATELAAILVRRGMSVVSSLAGITDSPSPRAGEVRSGGFGGIEGLRRYLHDERFDAVVDATHPFADVMPFNALAAATDAGVPRCRLLRDPWRPQPGDRWVDVPDLEAAAHAVATTGTRVFLAVGRNSLRAFGEHPGPWFLVRSIEPVETILPNSIAVRDRGPFTFEREINLLTEHGIDTIVAKNAGGQATIAKLEAARALRLAVVMIERPPAPPGPTVTSVTAAADWVSETVHS